MAIPDGGQTSHPDDGQTSHPDDGQTSSGLAAQDEAPTGQPGAPRQRITSRDWISSPAVQGLLALGIYAAVWLSTAVRPLVRHITRAQLVPQSPDPNFYVWSLRWWPYAVGHGLNPLYSREILAPAGHALAWVTTLPPLALLATPLTLAAGPVVSYNLLTALALPLSAWAAFVLCRRLTGQFWPSLVGGAVFGFSAYEMRHNIIGQIDLTYGLLLPILAYLVVLWWDKSISSRTFVIVAGITMTVQFYLFMETFAGLTGILAVSLVLGFALAGQSGRAETLRLARLTACAYAIAIVLAAPYLAYALATKPPSPPLNTAVDLASLVVPQPGYTLGIGWLARAAALPAPESAGGYVGVPLLVLAVLLAVTGWSSRLVRFLSCMLAFIVVAALGPDVYLEGHPVAKLPWAPLWHLPILRNAYPTRLMAFAFLALAVATALWLAGPARQVRVWWARWALAPLVIAAIALNTPAASVAAQSTVPAFISSGKYQRSLSPGETVVVVSSVREAGMLWQAEADFYVRIAGGYIGTGISHTELPQPVQDLIHATPARVLGFEAYIKSARVGAILLDVAHEPWWAAIFRRVGLVGHQVGGVEVYPTSDCRTCRTLDRSQIGRL